ncbi:MAG: transcriptional repressor [Candidatus Marinimicrobia bacterium]|nr:transcriptional repressor [Candidatus Neomarinimicrobiota bacterium]
MEKYLRKLKDHGLKVTERRKGIIQIFKEKGVHLTPHEVWKELQSRIDKCGLPSIYRNLESLTECGILTRIEEHDNERHYALCSADREEHHHHITCVECGKVEALNLCMLQDRQQINGYEIVDHFMQVNGICSDCNV